jgi:hypothetical protein
MNLLIHLALTLLSFLFFFLRVKGDYIGQAGLQGLQVPTPVTQLQDWNPTTP